MKDFFGIESKYQFEVFDLTAVITILNVALILIGFKYAAVFGLVNCTIFIVLNIKDKAHLNNYITQIALIVLNIYFLNM